MAQISGALGAETILPLVVIQFLADLMPHIIGMSYRFNIGPANKGLTESAPIFLVNLGDIADYAITVTRQSEVT